MESKNLASVVDLGLADDGAAFFVQDQLHGFFLCEVEQVHDVAGVVDVERATTETLTVQPVVLDELRDRGLRDELVTDVVLLRVGRDHQERLTSTRTAAAMDRKALDTYGFGRADHAALSDTVQRIRRRER